MAKNKTKHRNTVFNPPDMLPTWDNKICSLVSSHNDQVITVVTFHEVSEQTMQRIDLY